MLGILDIRKDGVYFDGSNTTNRILDVLEEERPKIIFIDELEKMPRTFQNQLLNFMESGRVKVDQQMKQYDFAISFSIIRDKFSPEKLAVAQGIFSSMFSAGAVIGVSQVSHSAPLFSNFV